MTRAAPALPLLAALSWLVACPNPEHRLILNYPDQEAFDQAVWGELFLGEGRTCAQLTAAPGEPHLSFDPRESTPPLGTANSGQIALLARVTDAECRLFLEGCVQAEIDPRQETTIRILLQRVTGARCVPGQECHGGHCVTSDGGARDAGIRDQPADGGADRVHLDSGAHDAGRDDHASPQDAGGDSGAHDAGRDDHATPQDAGGDSGAHDAGRDDRASPQDAGCDGGAACAPCHHCVAGRCEPDSSMRLRRTMAISNHASTTAVAGYSIAITVDTAQLTDDGKLQPDGANLRIIFAGGDHEVDIDRIAESPFGASDTAVWFALQADIPAQATDDRYLLQYGDPAAGAPPQDRAAVYLFWDDFESGDLGRWTSDDAFQPTTDRSRSGQYAMHLADNAGDDVYAVANGVSLADVWFESHWRTRETTPDVSQMVRKQAGESNYELNVEGGVEWIIAQRLDGSFERLATVSSAQPAEQWFKVTTVIWGTQMMVFVDDVPRVPAGGWHDVGSAIASGGVGFRGYYVGASNDWWIDDVKVRAYVHPEPAVELGPEQMWCP